MPDMENRIKKRERLLAYVLIILNIYDQTLPFMWLKIMIYEHWFSVYVLI